MPTSARFVGRLGGWEQKDGVWDGGTILPLCQRGWGGTMWASSPTFRLFVSATGVGMQLSGPGALIWSAPAVGADHGVNM